jgi:hypothetical protein
MSWTDYVCMSLRLLMFPPLALIAIMFKHIFVVIAFGNDMCQMGQEANIKQAV